jgi:hypothetical protein
LKFKLKEIKANMKKVIIGAFALAVFAACQQKASQGSENDGKGAAGTENATGDSKTNVENINNPATAADPNAAVDPATAPMISFEKQDINVGTINEGEKVEAVFKVTNTGKSPLIISEVKAACGCTVPNWPKEPIEPGKTVKILAVFDSEGKPGNNTKAITVYSNAPAPHHQVVANFSVTVNPKNK